jgi:CRP/FNR family nitrogen fixation transcriptional regulator
MLAHTVVSAQHGFTKPSWKDAKGAQAGTGIEMMGVAMNYEPNTEIYGEGEPAEYCYKVLHGAIRAYKLLNDGRRQISAFFLPGDLFGLEAGDEHRFTAEAIVEANVCVIKRSAIEAAAARDPNLARKLWNDTARALDRAQEHMLLLGRKNAQERVATFLLEMAKRESVSESVELPMSRQDIADYLGLTIETVSRTLSQFEAKATIALPSCRKIVLKDPAALRRLNA